MGESTGKTGARIWAAVAGVVSGAVFVAAAEITAFLVARDASPLLAAGSFVIDIVPQWAKELAIELFGANDKLFLLLTLGVGVLLLAAVAGLLERRRRWAGVAVFALAGVAGLLATVTRAGASGASALPPLVGAIAGCTFLTLSIRALHRWRVPAAGVEAGPDRRRFLALTAVGAAAAVLAGVGARLGTAATTSIAAARKALRLPEPLSRVTVPAGAELDIPGLSPLFTPNADFYRVDTALSVPAIAPADWRLTVDGMVGRKVELSFDELLRMGLREYAVTLTCVSNQVGGDLVGTARWLGVPVREILSRALPAKGADMVLSRSIDGFTASTPLDALTDPHRDAILAVAMNGEPLPPEHGFPVRMVVPGLYGYVSATKWLTRLTVTTFEKDQAYWTPRGYSAQAPIKLSSRIDTPRIDKEIPPGAARIAGVAWAQTVGIARVEVQIDQGPWQTATLSAPVSDDTWVQWFLDWNATSGSHTLVVRATDRQGRMQEQARTPIAPDGSTGWQSTVVRVGTAG
ncbi:DMSO/TMAO reductase YedYZ, molybdopterin-dependent catalytic subunit [Microbacterium azadirachtae]|uniref:DMSO/TMAO reductase YedYZ, molybdopterin-dependent catalytic subunit n=1 Tax=Microbacterium azadirachtae TaxID=582680 RepID=A0A1I6HXT8_9MICO|nr:molybdopterin-dependent oxidoreductase [Microbacterium azadirachtae]SFR59218.1 DMSO/TMAO reductase YedYZ, molybdopterin-dependent catalytic subunit [Microbacterium azadirachtae]